MKPFNHPVNLLIKEHKTLNSNMNHSFRFKLRDTESISKVKLSSSDTFLPLLCSVLLEILSSEPAYFHYPYQISLAGPCGSLWQRISLRGISSQRDPISSHPLSPVSSDRLLAAECCVDLLPLQLPWRC